ncbi:gag-Pol polyprotein [Trichonephila clavipes]|nr:gag-Pol polyprotein [Trichonephila clavipes]
MPTTRAMEAQFQTLLEKLTASMNANMGEMKSDLTASMKANMTEMKSELTTNIAEPSIKLSTYDGKSSWQVYKTQFSIVADANQWDSQTKACQLAASLRADAADILQTLPETQRLDFDALVNALELRFGEKCVKDYSRLQLKSRQQKVSKRSRTGDGCRRLSHLAFSDCPTK